MGQQSFFSAYCIPGVTLAIATYLYGRFSLHRALHDMLGAASVQGIPCLNIINNFIVNFSYPQRLAIR